MRAALRKLQNHGSHNDALTRLIDEAQAAANNSRDAEAEAIRLATEAKDEADTASLILLESDESALLAREHAKERVETRSRRVELEVNASLDQLAAKQEKVFERARTRGWRRVEKERIREQSTAQKAVKRKAADALRRSNDARYRAERAQQRAIAASQEAEKALGRARELAAQAASAAQEAAQQTTREAERLAGQAHDRAHKAQERAAAANRIRERVINATARSESPSYRSDVPLVAVATERDRMRSEQFLASIQPPMDEHQSINARDEQMDLNALTKDELLTVAQARGYHVSPAMKRKQVIKVLSASAAFPI